MSQTEVAIKLILDRWNGSISHATKHLNELTDDQLLQQVSPNKNRGIYILGHLVAVHDDMLILLGMGEKLFPELNETFIKQPDTLSATLPTVSELRNFWTKQNEYMKDKFSATTSDEWFTKHTTVSEEDFLKEPHRNKLNIIVTRTSHLQYHMGQLVLLKNK